MWRNLTTLHRNCVTEACKTLLTKKPEVLIRLPVNTVKYHSLSKLRNITYKPQCSILAKKSQHTRQRIEENITPQQNYNTFTYRTHTCGELRLVNEGEKVILCGWTQFVRLSKFLLLRDAYGVTQCVINEKKIDLNVPLETVVKIEGTVVQRPKKMINPKMETGEIEVEIDQFEVLNTVDNLPFNLRDYQKPKEQLRMQHRYIDLRFPEMQRNLRLRSNMLHNMRRFLVEKNGFVEVETPTLFCRTPGGAREFVVPTRHSGMFYSLVQSPQQFKQMLMSGGVDRYFQIARCYRDETTRPDRQPEFTQLDIELSFTKQNEVLSLIEELLYETYPMSLPKTPFKRITYKEALETYGTDKPDLSYDLKLIKIQHLFKEKHKFHAYLLPYPKSLGASTQEMHQLSIDLAVKYISKIVLPEKLRKQFGDFFFTKLEEIIGQENTCMVVLGNSYEEACLTLGGFRELIASILKSRNMLNVKETTEPLWLVDFPLFVNGENGLEPCHHPFTAPHPEDIHLLETEPLKVRSEAYDLVINGNEVGGGSVRVHDAELQEKLLRILKIEPDSLSHFLNALKSGCPPHAGIALGIDRLVSTACNAESIRDVIAFPKSHEGKDPLSGAPNTISDDDKKYYHISVSK